MLLPGTAAHRALLETVVGLYQADPRISAVVLFGSLGRGNWDEYSDIDLDVVVADEADLDPARELQALCEAISASGERVAILVPDGWDAADIVLESLMQLSVRYHRLAETSPNIVDSLHQLAGRLDPDEIVKAGEANRKKEVQASVTQLGDGLVRYAVGAQESVLRGRLWLTLELLHRMRGLIMEIYARTHGQARAHLALECVAGPSLRMALAAAVPTCDLASMRAALERLLEIIEDRHAELSNGMWNPSESQNAVIRRIRERFVSGEERN